MRYQTARGDAGGAEERGRTLFSYLVPLFAQHQGVLDYRNRADDLRRDYLMGALKPPIYKHYRASSQVQPMSCRHIDTSDRLNAKAIAKPLHRMLSAMGLILAAMVLVSQWQAHRIAAPAISAALGAAGWWLMRDAIRRAETKLRSQGDALDKNVSDLLEAAGSSRHQLIANVSHNIRNSITSILGYAEELEEPDLPNSEQRHAIRTIHRHGRHLLHVLNDAVDLTKLEANELKPEHRRYSPIKLLADLNSTLQVRATSKGLPYHIEYRGAIPQTIETDPIRLRQILLSVLGNAIKFTDSGDIRTVVHLERRGGGGPLLVFEVIDNGIGIAAHDHERIFEPFAQLGDYGGDQEEGTGLGLAIGRQLAMLLGGNLTLQASEPGQGSHFRLTVSTGSLDGVEMIEPADRGDENEPSSFKPAAQADVRHLNGRRVLVVEDGKDNQRLMKYLLRKSGAEVVLAEHGEVAVQVAVAARDAGCRFDVILMDMQMPVMDGYEATRELRRLGIDWPIIAVTAHALPEDRQKCLDAGCSDYHAKPIDRYVLIKAISDAAEPVVVSR